MLRKLGSLFSSGAGDDEGQGIDSESPRESPVLGAQDAGAEPGVEISAELAETIRGLVRTGRKIVAVKLYRDKTGADLKTAKDAVDAIERGHTPRMTVVVEEPRAPEVEEPTLDLLLRELLQSGRKIEAIRVYRERTEADLKAAKEAVEEYERSGILPLPIPSSWVEPAMLDLPFDAYLRDLLRAGRKIEAIRRYREQTGANLHEAKEAVEAMERDLQE
jgi:ribosomal protein L7/L12